MTLLSILRLRNAELRRKAGKEVSGKIFRLKLKYPTRTLVRLRESGSDINTFEEVVRSQVYRCVLPHLETCNFLIDLGANIGLATLYFAGRFPTCRFLSVEPNSSSYEVLNRNLAPLTAADRCVTVRAAVWGSETLLSADTQDDAEHFSKFALKESLEPAAPETMPGMRISKLLQMSGFERVDCLKVDIEGAEVELFKGDVGWLTRIACIAIEFHDDSRVRSHFDQIMREYGFQIFDTGSHTVVAVNTRLPAPTP